MANDSLVNKTKDLATKLAAIDDDEILRPELGVGSLRDLFGIKLAELRNMFQKAAEFAPLVADNTVSNINSALESIYVEISNQSQRTQGEYVTYRNQFTGNVTNSLENARLYWPSFVTAQIEKLGVLEGFESVISRAKVEADQVLNQVKEEGQKLIASATEAAKEIEGKARLTASKISVKDAQEQFAAAQKNLTKKVWLWAILTILTFGGFVVFASYLLTKAHVDENLRWTMIYYTAIRVTILTAMGAAANFCLKMLRAHLHMSEQNLHRQRIANSITAFVEASGPEQRDAILGKLVDAVIAFGSSGLLDKDDDTIYLPKLTIESITKNLSAKSGG